MCNPSPLGRCSTDASSAYETAELNLRDTSRQEREARVQLKAAHDDLESLQKANPKKPAFGSREDHALKAAKKNLDQSLASWDALKAKKAKASDDLKIKQMHLDTTPAGQKALLGDMDAENRAARLEIADAVSSWQAKVKDLKDSNGNSIASKEGKKTPEARQAFSKLYKEARQDLGKADFEFNAAKDKAATLKKKAYDYGNALIQNGKLQDQYDENAYRASVKSAKAELTMLMYQDRMDDLKKVLQKNFSSN